MADLQSLLGDDFKEGMTIDEINAALASKNYVDPTTLPKTVKKDVFDKAASELAAANKRVKELEAKNLTDDEKQQQALDEAAASKKNYDELYNRLQAEQIFVTNGFKKDDYKDLLDELCSDDNEKTLNRVNKTVDMLNAQKSILEKELKKQDLNNMPKAEVGDGIKKISTNYEKAIEEAIQNGDNAGAAFLIRKQQEENANKK